MSSTRISALAFLALAVFMLWSNEQLGKIDMMGDPGPLLMPRITGGLMAALALLLALRPDAGEAPKAAASALPLPAVAGLVAAVLGYAALFGILGFTLSTALFLATAILLFGPRRPRDIGIAAAVGIAVSLGLGLVLNGLLGVNLPGTLI
ncbi:tripartite tricarboxylate transporter TctB family protein [Mangrovicoccus sp. HB161399]|uniref:tripartite tricarboxylate transporter TctB family protein n=1 Tax=Mangrovicoccus sp. HB161399 TaxID=2720392 RepID=UPI001555855E|nr:tripartite tricarboxylate transporter TctB family protein [Mangrovicoccus sp. HB161399]